MFKIIRTSTGTQFFILVDSSHNTKSNNVKLVCSQFRTNLFKHTILCFGQDLCNSIPVEIKNLVNTSNLCIFKRSVKDYIIALQIS